MTQAKVRCAIYTRKSSDEGLEQDFTHLPASAGSSLLRVGIHPFAAARDPIANCRF